MSSQNGLKFAQQFKFKSQEENKGQTPTLEFLMLKLLFNLLKLGQNVVKLFFTAVIYKCS